MSPLMGTLDRDLRFVRLGGDKMDDAREAQARTEFNLGMSVRDSSSEGRARALTALTNARSFYTYEEYPERWAEITMELGDIYRIESEKTNNLNIAINFYEEALKVYHPETHPLECADCQDGLGQTIQLLSDGMDSSLKERAL